MPTQITTTNIAGTDTTVVVTEGLVKVTSIINEGRKNGDSFAAFTGQDGKGLTVDPSDVTDIREV